MCEVCHMSNCGAPATTCCNNRRRVKIQPSTHTHTHTHRPRCGMTRLTQKPFNAQHTPSHTLLTTRFRFTRSSHAFSVCHCGLCQSSVSLWPVSTFLLPLSRAACNPNPFRRHHTAAAAAAVACSKQSRCCCCCLSSPPRSRCGSRPPPMCASCQGRAVIRSECFHGRSHTLRAALHVLYAPPKAALSTRNKSTCFRQRQAAIE